jgi:hypothetical protein
MTVADISITDAIDIILKAQFAPLEGRVYSGRSIRDAAMTFFENLSQVIGAPLVLLLDSVAYAGDSDKDRSSLSVLSSAGRRPRTTTEGQAADVVSCLQSPLVRRRTTAKAALMG